MSDLMTVGLFCIAYATLVLIYLGLWTGLIKRRLFAPSSRTPQAPYRKL